MPANKIKAHPPTGGSNLKTKSQSSKTVSKKTAVAKNVKKEKEEKKTTIVNASVATTKVSKKSLSLEVHDLKGKVSGEIALPEEIFGAKINNGLMTQAVRVYLANQRMGTASVKTRGEVSGSTRKIYKQKGTGRARHGAKKAPIFVHGGIAFGPRPKDYSLKLPKKMKRAALFSALSSRLKDGEIKVIAGLEKIEPKTKEMAQIVKNLGLEKKKILLVLPFDKEKTINIMRAGRNIEGLNLAYTNGLTTFEVLNNKALVLAKESIEAMKKAFLGENKGE
ncbi:50S ribosomal protein L4 [Candidatus Microgenomates bacterium]|nr:MAG: 50S ribosomal protein L4 [Candidatus Microgenomates bacterium]